MAPEALAYWEAESKFNWWQGAEEAAAHLVGNDEHQAKLSGTCLELMLSK